jgi:integrase
MHFKRGSYFYVTTGTPRKWINLGKLKPEALRQWADLEGEKAPASTTTFAAAWERYQREVVPQKALNTQRDNLREGPMLLKVFGRMDLSAITPLHVRKYLDLRGQVAKVRATREKALLSHVFNKGREWGLTSAANPCAGIRGFRSARDRYVEDGEYQALYETACQPLRDALELALLTGQRPSDVLRWRRTDIRDGILHIRQAKTRTPRRLMIEGDLEAVINRCIERAKSHSVACLHLVQTEKGQPLTYRTLHDRFSKARTRAGVDFQFRDIRAKAGTDLEDLARAQALLGHKSRAMTESYIRDRLGDRVKPLR